MLGLIDAGGEVGTVAAVGLTASGVGATDAADDREDGVGFGVNDGAPSRDVEGEGRGDTAADLFGDAGRARGLTAAGVTTTATTAWVGLGRTTR